jgi:hypothetical protein
MEFITNKLHKILCAPFIIEESYLDPSSDIDDDDLNEIGGDDENVAELAADKRLRASRMWSEYLRGIRRIEKINNAATVVGLNAEFKDLVVAAIGRPPSSISDENPLTIQEVQSILISLNASKFNQQIIARKKQLESDISKPASIQSAVDILRKDIVGSGPLTAMKLLNPTNIIQTVPLRMRWADPQDLTAKGSPRIKEVIFDNTRPLQAQFSDLAHVLQAKGRLDLMKKLKVTYEARLALLNHYWPQLAEAQRKYTAMFYTIRNIADDFTRTDK